MNRALVLIAATSVLFATPSMGCRNAAVDDDDATDPPEVYVPECAAPVIGTCEEEGSIVRGTVRVSDELLAEATDGDLVLTLTHYRLGGGAAGGAFHAQTVVPDVDLASGPVPFQIDMCSGGAISEENCEFHLIAVLDRNSNNTGVDIVPEDGELVGRVVDVNVSCNQDSLCLDVVLDCTDGVDCVAFEDPQETCACDPNACESIYEACQ